MAKNNQGGGSILPYLPFKTFINFVDSLHANVVPTRIDRSLMGTMQGSYQSQLFSALHSLELISEKSGQPSKFFKELIRSEGEERVKKLEELAHRSYPFLFGDSLDLTKATSELVKEAFETNTSAKGETIRRSIKFFIDLCKASGISISPYIKPPKSTAGRKPKTAKKDDKDDKDKKGSPGEEGDDSASVDPEVGYHKSLVPLSGGQKATVTFPSRLSAADAKKLTKMLQSLCGVIEAMAGVED